MPTYTYRKNRGEPGFGTAVALVLTIWLFWLALVAGGIIGLLFLIKAIFF